jgi:type II secretory pathway pseudopilin PulG
MRDEDGYTLVEVIVAFAILAGSLLLGLEVFHGGLASLQRANRQLASVQRARQELTKLSLDPQIRPGILRGQVGGHTWRAEITSIPGTNSASSLHLLRVKMFVADNGDTALPEAILDTVLAPRVSPP